MKKRRGKGIMKISCPEKEAEHLQEREAILIKRGERKNRCNKDRLLKKGKNKKEGKLS